MMFVFNVLSLMVSFSNAEVCTVPYRTHEIQPNESLYTVARDEFGDFTYIDDVEYRSWRVLLAKNYNYINRCFDRTTCKQMTITDPVLEELFPIDRVDENPLPYYELKKKCDAFNQGTYISRYICSFDPGDLLYLEGTGKQTKKSRDHMVKKIAEDPTVINPITLFERESIYDLVNIAYSGFGYTESQLRGYTMSLGTIYRVKDPFVGAAESTCLDKFYPISYFYSINNTLEENIVDLSNAESLKQNNIKIKVIGY